MALITKENVLLFILGVIVGFVLSVAAVSHSVREDPDWWIHKAKEEKGVYLDG